MIDARAADPGLQHAPATARNRDAILDVIRTEIPSAGEALEIGSGTGEHAVYFASHLPALNWQSSDVAANLPGIAARVKGSGLANVARPVVLDVAEGMEITGDYDLIFSANTAHIMSADNVVRMVRLAAGKLRPGGRFLLYGPFREGGRFSSESNERFDRSLRQQAEHMGIRDLEWLQQVAAECGLRPGARYAMPANNLMLIFEPVGEAAG